MIEFRVAMKSDSKISEYTEGWVYLGVNGVDIIGMSDMFSYTSTNVDYWLDALPRIISCVKDKKDFYIWLYDSLDIYVCMILDHNYFRVKVIQSKIITDNEMFAEGNIDNEFDIFESSEGKADELELALTNFDIEYGVYTWDKDEL